MIVLGVVLIVLSLLVALPPVVLYLAVALIIVGLVLAVMSVRTPGSRRYY